MRRSPTGFGNGFFQKAATAALPQTGTI